LLLGEEFCSFLGDNVQTISSMIFTTVGRLITTGAIGADTPQESLSESVAEQSGDLGGQLQQHASEVADTLNQNEAVREVSAGILQPIFDLAQYMDFAAFYWVAFALMVAGVVSFAGQLVLAKFFLLFKGSLNLREIISDGFCLLISLVGLVLTTQAASNYSTFTDNSFGVLSATGVGALVGFVFYWWGQKTEFQAARRIPADEK
jgi:hypothetical protein